MHVQEVSLTQKEDSTVSAAEAPPSVIIGVPGFSVRIMISVAQNSRILEPNGPLGSDYPILVGGEVRPDADDTVHPDAELSTRIRAGRWDRTSGLSAAVEKACNCCTLPPEYFAIVFSVQIVGETSRSHSSTIKKKGASLCKRVLTSVTKLLWGPPMFQSFCGTRVLFASCWHERDRASGCFFYYQGIVLRCDDRQGSGNEVRAKRAAHVSSSGQPSEFTPCENKPRSQEP